MMDVEIRKYLADNGHWTIDTDLFVSRMPGNPVNATCVYNSPVAGAPERVFCKGVICENPHGQVQVRRTSYLAAELEAQSISKLLDGTTGTLTGVRYISIEASPQFRLNRDESETPVCAVNFSCLKELSTS
jgi:hypothetical protein